MASCLAARRIQCSVARLVGSDSLRGAIFTVQYPYSLYTSAKIIQLNEYGCRDAPCEKSWKQGNPLSNTIKDTSTSMRNPLPKYVGRVTHDCASILDSIAKGISLFPRFFAWCIPISIFE